MPSAPIGIFDSGLGGLTGYRALRKLLPEQPLVYFGDSARVPYGTKTVDEIRKFASQDVRFLLSKNVSAIMIACGTVSSNAIFCLKEQFDIPFVGVVTPAAKAAANIASAGGKKVLVLGTDATIRSNSFYTELKNLNPSLEIAQKACPLFVPLAENLHTSRGDSAAVAIAEEYLRPYFSFSPDVIILGCTHFPLLSDIISDVFPGPVLISAGEEAAKEMAAIAAAAETPARQSSDLDSFFTSGDPVTFARDASVFLDSPVMSATQIPIERY